MSTLRKTAKETLTRGRDTAVRVGKVAKSTATVAAKAGAAAAMAAGSVEARKAWKQTDPAVAKKRTAVKIGAALAGAAMLGAAGVAIAKSRSKPNGRARAK